MAPDPPFNQFNGFTTYLRRPRVRATPPRLGGTPRPPVLYAGERKSTVWRLDSRWQWDTAKPRSPGCGARRGLEGQDERSPCNLSLSTILFARAKEVSHFGPETGKSR